MYKNQNYMTNKKIKKEVDKNQKDYEEPQTQEEETTNNQTEENNNTTTETPTQEEENNNQQQNNTQEESKQTYNFISYGDSEGTDEWARGTVETTGINNNGYTQVEVKTNTISEFIGQKFYIDSNAKTDGTLYPLYSDAGETAVGIYVSISQ